MRLITLNVLPKVKKTYFAIYINQSYNDNPFKLEKSTKIYVDYFFWQGRPSHRNVVLPNYFLFDKFPGIVQNGKNFIIVVTSKTIYGISTILVLKF